MQDNFLFEEIEEISVPVSDFSAGLANRYRIWFSNPCSCWLLKFVHLLTSSFFNFILDSHLNFPY